MATIVKRQFRIGVLQHKGTDLLIATSEDLKGLMVHARTEEELEERIPEAIRELLEAEGQKMPPFLRLKSWA